MERNVTIADTMFNMHCSSGASDDYRKGILVGMVGGLMAHGLTFEQAITQVAFHMPDAGARVFPGTVPESWIESLCTRMTALGKRWIHPI